ncbi:deoxyhypusine hydroxylase-like [Patiria miniata]|uniref:Deoxyhypusine hydroxylase n=1 Tax=Patiria miniata TaxID=46514 RepID=A0A914AYR9_PATMI|nr:deoxyhypusine hydroxylase-like [Patiria miniata]
MCVTLAALTHNFSLSNFCDIFSIFCSPPHITKQPASQFITMPEDTSKIERIGAILVDPTRPLPERFRALFTLRNLGGSTALACIGRCFADDSALLKHECAYCLGQMQDEGAISMLVEVLEDVKQEPIVRHEAGEALGAIGSPDILNILKKYEHDPITEIAETCQLAIQRIEWLQSEQRTQEESQISANPFKSVDPAPPAVPATLEELQARLLDEDASLFDRYRAMFALRNRNDEPAVRALAQGLQCKSALFRHEIAYVLGQMQHGACIPQLLETLAKSEENSMVRHECAEALGSIAQEGCLDKLRDYIGDGERVVRESCVIALDMGEHETSGEFHYCDGLVKLESESKHQESS